LAIDPIEGSETPNSSARQRPHNAIWQSTRLRVLKQVKIANDVVGAICYLAIDPIEGSETPATTKTAASSKTAIWQSTRLRVLKQQMQKTVEAAGVLFGNRPD